MKMAFDPEATKLSDVLAGGYHINAKLLALLGRPLDSRGQEEAMAFSQEISRVFMVSMSMLKPDDSKRTLKTMAPEIRTGDSYGVCTLAKDKVISPEGVISHKNIRREEFTRKEVTSSPHSKDGYQWQKYGQKNIQKCSFMRYYFRCHDRRCNAKKKVQQQEGSDDAPMFEVTYVNDHTCHHVALANNDDGCSQKSLPTTTTAQSSLKAAANTGRNGGALFDLLTRNGGAEENEAIVSCLATVVSGTAPCSPGAEPGAGRQQPSADGGSMVTDGAVRLMDTGYSWEDPSPSFWPAEAGEMMDLCDDVHMGASRFVDTAWPQY